MTHTPQQGGRMRGGPYDGKLMAANGTVMPALDKTGKIVGTYIWADDHWEFEEDDGKPAELYP
jgi:hypothetical protein